MGWLVSEENFDKSKIELFGSKFCIGNGNFGYRGTLEEYGKEQLCALTLSEIYDDNGCGWREPVNMPNPFHINLSVGGGNISVLGSNVAKH
ncbi:MAG: glycoside hydrolase family 65 protein, partial [Lachnospiraceae bacterium]